MSRGHRRVIEVVFVLGATLVSACGTSSRDIEKRIVGTWLCVGNNPLAQAETFYPGGLYVKYVRANPYAQKPLDQIDHYQRGQYRVEGNSVNITYHYESPAILQEGKTVKLEFPIIAQKRIYEVKSIDAERLHLISATDLPPGQFCQKVPERQQGERYAEFHRYIEDKIITIKAQRDIHQQQDVELKTLLAEKARLLVDLAELDLLLRAPQKRSLLVEIRKTLPEEVVLREIHLRADAGKLSGMSSSEAAALQFKDQWMGSKLLTHVKFEESKPAATLRIPDQYRFVVLFNIAKPVQEKNVFLVHLSEETASLAEHQQQWEELKAMYNALILRIFKSKSLEDLLKEAQALTHNQPLTLDYFTPGDKQTGLLFDVYPIKVRIKGEYKSIESYVLALQDISEVLQIEELHLYSESARKKPTELALDIALLMYVLHDNKKHYPTKIAPSTHRLKLVGHLPYDAHVATPPFSRDPFAAKASSPP